MEKIEKIIKLLIFRSKLKFESDLVFMNVVLSYATSYVLELKFRVNSIFFLNGRVYIYYSKVTSVTRYITKQVIPLKKT